MSRTADADDRVRVHVADELRHLRAVEERGDSPVAIALVVTEVLLALLVIVGIEVAVAMAFYVGWL
jgi:hypothetical protein